MDNKNYWKIFLIYADLKECFLRYHIQQYATLHKFANKELINYIIFVIKIFLLQSFDKCLIYISKSTKGTLRQTQIFSTELSTKLFY